ncbi:MULTISPECIES: hypothetical protein [unclassified Burkholderia]|uniref:hypothetical protein n=1 Tax=unclassified Burkholderia TaxID=2613784 RepID=UPI002AB2BA7E|nr:MULTISPECIES: hypothetical protein [unclassified Burkholderia]
MTDFRCNIPRIGDFSFGNCLRSCFGYARCMTIDVSGVPREKILGGAVRRPCVAAGEEAGGGPARAAWRHAAKILQSLLLEG